jgi:hypothetical protein
MYHVRDVFKNYGEQYSNLIIDEIDRHGTNIENQGLFIYWMKFLILKIVG